MEAEGGREREVCRQNNAVFLGSVTRHLICSSIVVAAS